MRFRFYYFLFPLLFCACTNTKKISDHLSEKIKPQTTDTKEWLIIKSQQSTLIGNKSEEIKHTVIPALLYWRVRTDYSNIIDEYFAITVLSNYIYQAADSLKLKNSLGNKKIVIEINQLPHDFFYSERKHTIIVFLGWADWTKEMISPSQTDLAATITITDNEKISSSFSITIKNEEQQRKKVSIRKHYNYWNFLDQYLADYQNQLKRIATDLILQINGKID